MKILFFPLRYKKLLSGFPPLYQNKLEEKGFQDIVNRNKIKFEPYSDLIVPVFLNLTRTELTIKNHLTKIKIKESLSKWEYTIGILQIYWSYTFKVYLTCISSTFEAYVKYTSSILEVYIKYTSTYQIKGEEVYFKSLLFRQKKYI